MTTLLWLKSMLLANAAQKKEKKKMQMKKTHRSKKLNLKICRVCGQEKGSIPIFDHLTLKNIPQEIQHFTGVAIDKSDSLSKNMCQNCFDLLNGCIMFRDVCQMNNVKLLKAIKKEQTTDSKRQNNINRYKNEDSYNIPSPIFSDDNSNIWGCHICNKEFYDLPSYNEHLDKCSTKAATLDAPKPTKKPKKQRDFLCDICGKTAYSNASLLIHMVTHKNIFPFKCDVCPYQGRTLDLLRVHKRSHLIDKPYKCSKCPQATTTASNLAKHMRHVHSDSRPFKCTYCNKAFTYPNYMKKHIKDIHLRQSRVECDVCFKKFNTKKILQGHKYKIHKIKSKRQGRLPLYLLHQTEDPIDETVNVNECDPSHQLNGNTAIL